MQILDLETIKRHLDLKAAFAAVEAGFADYSKGLVTVPPVGYLSFPKGDCHIKYGYITGDKYFVIKVVSGFHGNTAIGLRPSIGLMLVCSAETGYPEALLQDEGHLTDVRTAIAGAIAAKYLGPKRVETIGILGVGIQAKLQLEHLREVTNCRRVMVWNHVASRTDAYVAAMSKAGFNVVAVPELETLVRQSNLIVTTTPSTAPLIAADWVQPGTHITAVGADCPGKQELAVEVIQNADVCVVDSMAQCTDHGEIQIAYREGLVKESDLVELGAVIDSPARGRTSEEQITVADLTGVAVQDIAIAKTVYQAWCGASGE